MTHPFPCPSCGYGNDSSQDPVWKVSRTNGIAQCLDCGFITDEEIVRKYMIETSSSFCYEHTWVDTGAKRSWCSKCDKEGVFSFEKGWYTER